MALLAIILCVTALTLASAAQQAAAQDTQATGPSTEDRLLVAKSDPLPIARADAYNVAQDKTRYVEAPGVLRNDSQRRPLHARFVLGVEYGHLELYKGGGFRYTPDQNFRGTDYFKYRACERAHPSRCSKAVTVSLTVSGSAPVANPNSYDARRNHKKVIRAPGITNNDYDANGDAIRVISYTQPRRGGVVVGTHGYVRFIPDHNFVGKTGFTYWIGDGTGLRDSARVTMRVRG